MSEHEHGERAQAGAQQGGPIGQQPGRPVQQAGVAAMPGEPAHGAPGYGVGPGVQGYAEAAGAAVHVPRGVPMMGAAATDYMQAGQMPGAQMQGPMPGAAYASPQMAHPQMPQPQMPPAANPQEGAQYLPQYAAHYPSQHVPQYPPQYAPQYAVVPPAAMGAGPQQPPTGTPGAAGGQAGRGQAGIASLMEEISSGGTGLNSLTQLLNLDDTEFWKGALVGAAAVVLFTNESVQNALFKTGAKTSDAVRGGVDKLKSAASDAAGGAKE